MTVVVGGVGNIWGTLARRRMIGFLQKGIEWLNPSNTLAAQTYMILFIILFIQFRPKRHHRAQGPRGGGLRATSPGGAGGPDSAIRAHWSP
jgi:branched-subunit amino acid ABC-type transport system permease component